MKVLTFFLPPFPAMGAARAEPAQVGRFDRDATGLPGAAPVPAADREQKVPRHQHRESEEARAGLHLVSGAR